MPNIVSVSIASTKYLKKPVLNSNINDFARLHEQLALDSKGFVSSHLAKIGVKEDFSAKLLRKINGTFFDKSGRLSQRGIEFFIKTLKSAKKPTSSKMEDLLLILIDKFKNN